MQNEDCTHRTEIADLLRSNTSNWGGEQIYLKEHTDHVKEGQNDISYNHSESIAVVSSSSFEKFAQEGS